MTTFTVSPLSLEIFAAEVTQAQQNYDQLDMTAAATLMDSADCTDVADAMDTFAKWWNLGREDMQSRVKYSAELLTAAAEGYRGADSGAAAAVAPGAGGN